jgi:hypothetical protein
VTEASLSTRPSLAIALSATTRQLQTLSRVSRHHAPPSRFPLPTTTPL